MASEDQLRSWKRTSAYLLDARNNLSESAEGVCQDEIAEFQEYLDHNELEIALDCLDVVVEKSAVESLRVVELLALAAASMGLGTRVERYDRHLSEVRGIPYKTKL